jgi:peptide-methionine (S)-S-oxide reductase
MTETSDRSRAPRISRRARPALFVLILLAVSFGVLKLTPSIAAEGRAIPAPATDEAAGQPGSEVAVLAAGCFWGVQGVFQHVAGVTNAVSGYAGGEQKTAQYNTVSMGKTGHAESVQVTFDPSRISYGRILQIYFSVAHNPTELNRQGPDIGTQYRSAIFPTSAEQERIAKAYIAQLNSAHVFDAAIATKIEPGQKFYAAEAYH